MDLRSLDSKSLATLALLSAFGAFQGLLTFCADLSAPDWLYKYVLFAALVSSSQLFTTFQSLAEMYIRTLFYFFNKNGRISTPRARQKLSVTHSKDMGEICCFLLARALKMTLRP